MKTKVMSALICTVLVLTLLFVACAQPAPSPQPGPAPTPAPAEKPIELKFANFMPPVAVPGKIWDDYCKEVEKRANGKVKITYYPGGSLLDGPRMADGVASGIADMGFIMMAYTPGRYPVSGAIELPLGSPSAFVATHANTDFHNKFPLKELDELYPICFVSTGPSVLWSTKPVRTMEDMKGLRIRAAGLAAAVINIVGGAPDSTPATEVYDAVLKGVIDGAYMPFEAGKSFRYAEVCDYVTNTWQAGSQAPFLAAMNKNTWNNLPPDIQTIFSEVAAEYVDKSAITMNLADSMGVDACKENNVEMIDLSPEEGARWEQAVQPIIAGYISGVVERGYTEQEAKGFVDYMKERIAYWVQQQKEQGIKSAAGPPELR